MECFETFLLISEMLSFEHIQWKKKQKLNYAKMHMQGEGKSSQFYPQIQGLYFRLHWFLLEWKAVVGYFAANVLEFWTFAAWKRI